MMFAKLTDFEREYAAAALRFVAKGIPDLSPPRRKPGGQRVADPAQLAIEYVFLRMKGGLELSSNAAFKELAARFDLSPALIEAVTYRHSGHSRADPAKYRPEGELERWLQRVPVNLYRARLLEIGIAEGTLKDIEAEAMRKVDEATATAKASPVPALDAIERNVWANGGAAWRN